MYEQIKQQMRLAVAAGAVEPGEQLPTVRDLAEDLRINFNTVAKAYRELQAEELFVSQRGRGTFVSQSAPAIGKKEARRAVREMLQEAVDTADRLDVGEEELAQMWGDVLEGREEK